MKSNLKTVDTLSLETIKIIIYLFKNKKYKIQVEKNIIKLNLSLGEETITFSINTEKEIIFDEIAILEEKVDLLVNQVNYLANQIQEIKNILTQNLNGFIYKYN